METMRFSSRVDISEPNPIAKAEVEAKTSGITLGKLNDSNPTKHALAPELLPDIYGAEPRGQRYAREALAAFLQGRGNDVAVEDLYILSSTSEAYSCATPAMLCSRRNPAILSSNRSHDSNVST